MMKMKHTVAAMTIALLTAPASISAQETEVNNNALANAFSKAAYEVEGTMSVDVMSQYMWRGIDKGGVTIRPTGKFSWRDISLQVQGTTGFDKDDAKELNLTLGYQLGPVNFGVTDYWSSGLDKDGRNLYFAWDAAESGHRYEANVGYTMPYFSLQAYTMFWGNDFKYSSRADTDNRTNGKRAFSTYIELRVPFYMGGFDWDLTAGVTPFKSAYNIVPADVNSELQYVEKSYFYASGPACVLASVRATKRLEFGDIKVPIFAELNTNPYLKRAGLIVGLTVEPF